MSKGPLHIFNEDSLDMTGRERPGKEKAEELVARIHEAGRLVLADISTYEEGMTAADIGADAISTTLSGYTPYSPQLSGMNIMPIIFHEIGHSLGINAATHTISQMIGEKEGFRSYLSKYYNYTLYRNNNGLLIGRG